MAMIDWGKKVEVAAKHYELSADSANGFSIVFAKVGAAT
jgi:hypothetical protein